MKMSVKQKSENKFNNNRSSQHDDLSHLAKAIIANAGVGIYIVQNGQFVYVSDLYQKITGYSAEELIGAKSLNNIYPDDREKVRYQAIKCLKKESFEPYEYRFVMKNGEIIWALETVSSIVYKEERATLGSFMDISERKRIEEKLRNEEQLFRVLTEQSSDVIVLVNREGVITYENPAVDKILGLKSEERIGGSPFENIHPDDLNLVTSSFRKLFEDKNVPAQKHEVRLRQIDGTWRTFESVASNLAQNNVVDTIIVNLHDITKRKAAEESLRQSEEKYRTILENIQEAYFEVDLAGNFTFFNDSMCWLTGYSKEELLGMNHRQLTDEENSKQVFQAFNKVFNTGKPTRGYDWQIIRKDGTKRYIEASASLQKDPSDQPTGFRGVIRDITERKRIEQQLNYLVTHDVLTGLPNRILFMDRLELALAQSRRNRHKLAVMMFDLDEFKNVNDTLGHMMGDKLLKEVGNRLTGLLRQNDTVARLGGDEFIVLLSDFERMEDVNRIAGVILKAFQQPFVCDNHKIDTKASIGIAIYPDDCEDMESLLKKSDMAMYFVKVQGRNGYKFFADAH
jgi:diguanylate cyclase (GGDEF)-like protein/PAS domain S-box-containing protein